MATILLAWELGGGLGHFMNLRPLAEGLLRRGHRVVAVLRDLSAARQFLVDPNVDILQAPFKHARIRDIEPTCTFAQILHNCGFGDADELLTLAEAWRKLYDYLQPDLIIFDHSPTALLASAGYPARRALIGTGFFSPPDTGAPGLPNLRTWLTPNQVELDAHEAQVLANINAALARWSMPPLACVAELYDSRVAHPPWRGLSPFAESAACGEDSRTEQKGTVPLAAETRRGLSPFEESSEQKGTVPLSADGRRGLSPFVESAACGEASRTEQKGTVPFPPVCHHPWRPGNRARTASDTIIGTSVITASTRASLGRTSTRTVVFIC